ncbi:MAG: hypothetical protein DRR19_20160 [Candidatus Parabeggiatoa sp. nov. 1]|nr:MAG: hypothetical protein DRR19_20160 [Gammaproteobacteria bacterium]
MGSLSGTLSNIVPNLTARLPTLMVRRVGNVFLLPTFREVLVGNLLTLPTLHKSYAVPGWWQAGFDIMVFFEFRSFVGWVSGRYFLKHCPESNRPLAHHPSPGRK